MQSVEEKASKLIELLNEKGLDSNQVIDDLFNELQNKKEIPISS